jgi:hypothetical protein
VRGRADTSKDIKKRARGQRMTSSERFINGRGLMGSADEVGSALVAPPPIEPIDPADPSCGPSAARAAFRLGARTPL